MRSIQEKGLIRILIAMTMRTSIGSSPSENHQKQCGSMAAFAESKATLSSAHSINNRKGSPMSGNKAIDKIDEAHKRAFVGSKTLPNRSDPFAYSRIFSRIINGVYDLRDSTSSNFSPSL